MLVPTVGAGLDVPTSLGGLGRALIVEAAIGVMLGMSAALIVAGARQAGEVVGGQAGLSAAALLDPEASGEMTPLGHLYGLVALMVFLALDGPVMLVKSLAESYHAEMENRSLEGLLLLPSDPRALYYGKAVANWLQLFILGVALTPVMVILYDAGTVRVLQLVGVIALGSAGLSAPGTLYAAMTAQVRSKQTLLPLLLFPLIVPALLASVKATSLVILGDPMEQSRSWIGLLIAFDAIYLSLCGLLFSRVVEE